MTKLERIEEHIKYNKEWHLKQIRFYRLKGEIAKNIVKALPEEEVQYEMELGSSSIELTLTNETEARKGREVITNAIEGIVKWEKDFNAYDTSIVPKWRWTTEVEIIPGIKLYIHIGPTSPKPDCVPRIVESSPWTSKSWVCEKGGGE